MIGALGDLVEDVLVELQSPIHHASDTQSRITRRRGGSAATVAVMSASSAGAARFIGQIGLDEVGERMLADLAAHGVDHVGVRVGRTGTIVVLVEPDGERTMLTDRGDASALSVARPEWLEGLSVLHVPFYSLAHEPLASVAVELIGLAKSQGIVTSIDVSSVSVLSDYGCDRSRSLIGSLAPTVVFFNREEASALEAERNPHEFDADYLVLKEGAAGARLWSANNSVVQIPVGRTDRVLNTTGAGDAFAAGFLTRLVIDGDAVASVAAGHDAAGSHLLGPATTK